MVQRTKENRDRAHSACKEERDNDDLWPNTFPTLALARRQPLVEKKKKKTRAKNTSQAEDKEWTGMDAALR
jgi:hypothetical protein